MQLLSVIWNVNKRTKIKSSMLVPRNYADRPHISSSHQELCEAHEVLQLWEDIHSVFTAQLHTDCMRNISICIKYTHLYTHAYIWPVHIHIDHIFVYMYLFKHTLFILFLLPFPSIWYEKRTCDAIG